MLVRPLFAPGCGELGARSRVMAICIWRESIKQRSAIIVSAELLTHQGCQLSFLFILLRFRETLNLLSIFVDSLTAHTAYRPWVNQFVKRARQSQHQSSSLDVSQWFFRPTCIYLQAYCMQNRECVIQMVLLWGTKLSMVQSGISKTPRTALKEACSSCSKEDDAKDQQEDH